MQYTITSKISERNAPAFSGEDLALRFSDHHAEDLRYTAALHRWSRWNGNRWETDTTLDVFDLVRDMCCQLAALCDEDGQARRITSAPTIAAIERLARSDRRHAAIVDQWDSDPWGLNTPAGTVDLKTGELRPALRGDYCTKSTAVAPSDVPPLLWLQFLERSTGGDRELEVFLQKMCGYCLTGVTREQVFFFLYGQGANGKGVLVNTFSAVLGDYARTAAMSSFTVTANEGHPTDLAGLIGMRMVSAVETEDGARWAEAKIKTLTGGDRISARFMRQDFFDYTPQFKLVIAGNHHPGLRSTGEAIRRRLRLIPFKVVIPESERDEHLSEKLKAEYPGILQWAIEGCMAWQREGLKVPSAVKATDDYVSEEDALQLWLDERCVVGRQHMAAIGRLYDDWRIWCERRGEYAGSEKAFSTNLVAREFERDRKNRTRVMRGLALVLGAPPLGEVRRWRPRRRAI